MVAGSDFGLSIVAEDAYGNPATQFTGNISIALSSNPEGATLTGGSLVEAATDGVASFGSSLTIEKAGSGYTIQATGAGLTSVTTASINVAAGAASQLVVQSQPPSSLAAGSGFGLTVVAEDAFGNINTSFTGPVSVGLPTGTGDTLAGSTTTAAVGGKASFQGLTLSGSGTPVSLQVNSTGLTGATTAPIALASTQTPTGTPSPTPTGTPSPTPTGTTPPVRLEGIQVVKNKKHQVIDILQLQRRA